MHGDYDDSSQLRWDRSVRNTKQGDTDIQRLTYLCKTLAHAHRSFTHTADPATDQLTSLSNLIPHAHSISVPDGITIQKLLAAPVFAAFDAVCPVGIIANTGLSPSGQILPSTAHAT